MSPLKLPVALHRRCSHLCQWLLQQQASLLQLGKEGGSKRQRVSTLPKWSSPIMAGCEAQAPLPKACKRQALRALVMRGNSAYR